MWSVGCILGELSDGQPLFPGESEIDQVGEPALSNNEISLTENESTTTSINDLLFELICQIKVVFVDSSEDWTLFFISYLYLVNLTEFKSEQMVPHYLTKSEFGLEIIF